MYNINEKDWKLYSERLPLWQERFIKERLDYYSSILERKDTPSFIFYELFRAISKDKHNPGITIDRNSRSYMLINIETLINYKVITIVDLEGFSNELIEEVKKGTIV